ncbi:hypothetical protein [Rhodothermus profundi]|uniref:Outer membrane protein beta-barrel domain-containing protein n=1 Tax=Rhodothermus profundi TaxID=633813 RepID=A0A1M6PVI3_9BACT|nr:hypothetical protein [Rhodothermus profundi]SHK11880.1 hypothetical protein SAMN04488087_0345 [Rhodothermus profundi]
MKRRPCLLFALLLLMAGTAFAQRQTRVGLGFNALLTTAEGLGLGVRARAAAPVSADLSLAVDLGFTGFIFRGRDEASYVFDPQLSAIVTFPPRERQAFYILGGVGAYAPLSDRYRGESGPTVHFGFGWVQLLRETQVFYEINPALVVGERSVDVVLPLRVGVIF